LPTTPSVPLFLFSESSFWYPAAVLKAPKMQYNFVCPHGNTGITVTLSTWYHCKPLKVEEEPTRKGALLDLVLTNKEGLVVDVKAGGRLSCSDHEMVEFRILHGGSMGISRIKTLNFRRANFGLFKELLGGIPWAGGSKSAGHSLNDTSSMLRSNASP